MSGRKETPRSTPPGLDPDRPKWYPASPGSSPRPSPRQSPRASGSSRHSHVFPPPINYPEDQDAVLTPPPSGRLNAGTDTRLDAGGYDVTPVSSKTDSRKRGLQYPDGGSSVKKISLREYQTRRETTAPHHERTATPDRLQVQSGQCDLGRSSSTSLQHSAAQPIWQGIRQARSGARYTTFLDFWKKKRERPELRSNNPDREPRYIHEHEQLLLNLESQLGEVELNPENSWISQIQGHRPWNVDRTNSIFHAVFATLLCKQNNTIIVDTVGGQRAYERTFSDGFNLSRMYIEYMTFNKKHYEAFVTYKLEQQQSSLKNYDQWLWALSDHHQKKYIPGDEVKASLADMLDIKLLVFKKTPNTDPYKPFHYFPSSHRHRCTVLLAETDKGHCLALLPRPR